MGKVGNSADMVAQTVISDSPAEERDNCFRLQSEDLIKVSDGASMIAQIVIGDRSAKQCLRGLRIQADDPIKIRDGVSVVAHFAVDKATSDEDIQQSPVSPGARNRARTINSRGVLANCARIVALSCRRFPPASERGRSFTHVPGTLRKVTPEKINITAPTKRLSIVPIHFS